MLRLKKEPDKREKIILPYIKNKIPITTRWIIYYLNDPSSLKANIMQFIF